MHFSVIYNIYRSALSKFIKLISKVLNLYSYLSKKFIPDEPATLAVTEFIRYEVVQKDQLVPG